jgi:hypothetical protein
MLPQKQFALVMVYIAHIPNFVDLGKPYEASPLCRPVSTSQHEHNITPSPKSPPLSRSHPARGLTRCFTSIRFRTSLSVALPSLQANEAPYAFWFLGILEASSFCVFV